MKVERIDPQTVRITLTGKLQLDDMLELLETEWMRPFTEGWKIGTNEYFTEERYKTILQNTMYRMLYQSLSKVATPL